VFPKQRDLFEQLAHAQSPEALFITCSDSRIMPNLITQTRPGDLFICRNAGNMVPPYGEVNGGVSATIEYSVCVLKVQHIIVCGHTDCGAMKGVIHPELVQDLPTVRSWLAHGEVARHVVNELYPNLPEKEMKHVLTEQNVVAQLANLRTHPSVAARLAAGKISLHGWMYHIATGRVEIFDPEQGRFVPLEASTAASASDATPQMLAR
jgi:carbonic anhydrase